MNSVKIALRIPIEIDGIHYVRLVEGTVTEASEWHNLLLQLADEMDMVSLEESLKR